MTDPTSETPATSATPSEPDYRAAVARLIETIDRDGDGHATDELRQAAAEELARIERVAASDEADDDDGHRSPADFLVDALHRFETDHPSLTKAVNDVSHYLSGMGI